MKSPASQLRSCIGPEGLLFMQHFSSSRISVRHRGRSVCDSLRLLDVKPPCLDCAGASASAAFSQGCKEFVSEPGRLLGNLFFAAAVIVLLKMITTLLHQVSKYLSTGFTTQSGRGITVNFSMCRTPNTCGSQGHG